MAELAVITPTRGRPARFDQMVDAICATATGAVQIWAGVDDDDNWIDYTKRNLGSADVVWTIGPRRSLSAWTNDLARAALEAPDPPRYFASLGDDHLPRTPAWDESLIEAIEQLGGSGFAYGNDLLQGERMPTAWVVSADVVRALGWMMLPVCAHMYVDNAVLELGRAAECIAYRPDVVIEHLHPVAGKAAWDPSYAESNAHARYVADAAAFEAWKADGLAADVARVRELVGRGQRV